MATKSRWIAGLSLVGLILFGPGLLQGTWLSVKQWRLERRLRELKAQHERLSAEQARLVSDPTYVEGLIRTTFKVAQPGEYVVPLDDSTISRR